MLYACATSNVFLCEEPLFTTDDTVATQCIFISSITPVNIHAIN